MIKDIEEFGNHSVRKCYNCGQEISFGYMLRAQKADIIQRGYTVEIEGIDEEDYEWLERLWNDIRVKFLCCDCNHHCKGSARLVKSLLDFRSNGWTFPVFFPW